MLTLNRNILSIPVYLLGNLGKEHFRDFLSFKREGPLKDVKEILLFISSIGKREFLSFPSRGTVLFREKVEEGLREPERFGELVWSKNLQKGSIIPLLFPITPYRDALILLVVKEGERFTKKEIDILKLYFEERIKRIYIQGKRFVKEGEGLSSLIYLLNTKEKIFLEKISTVFDLAQKLIKRKEVFSLDLTEFLFTVVTYDLGKLFFRDEVLLGKRDLEAKDKFAIVNHPYYTLNLLNHIEVMNRIKDIIKAHHENYNGKGYPQRIGGREIPEGARLLRILDTIGALTTFRPYRKKLTLREALSFIEDGLGVAYDPEMGINIVSSLNVAPDIEKRPHKYINKEVIVTLKKHPKSKMEGRVKEEGGHVLMIVINQYFTRWNETQLPPLPEDKVFLSFPTLEEELQGEVMDVSYTSNLTIKVDIMESEQIRIRRNPRVPWIIPMEISDGETHCLALTTDISSQGAQIIPLGTGTKKTFKKRTVEMSFALPPNVKNPVHFQVEGEVIRYSKGYTPPFYKIVRFVGMEEEKRVILEEFIRERQIDILFLE